MLFWNIQEKGDDLIKGIGLDVIELKRIKRSIEKNNRIIGRILTPQEQQAFHQLNGEHRQIEYLAGRFAAKEAFAKAAGTGIGALSFQHIEVLANDKGAPQLTAQGFETEQIFISITHSREFAAAQVIITT